MNEVINLEVSQTLSKILCSTRSRSSKRISIIWRSLKAVATSIVSLSLCLATSSTVVSAQSSNNVALRAPAQAPYKKPYALLHVPSPKLLHKQPTYTAASAPDTENQFYYVCQLLLAHHEIAKASKFSHTAIVNHPTWSAPHQILGAIAELSLEDDAAIKHYKRGIETAPNCLDSYSALAEILRRCTDYQGALEVEKIALAKIGKNPSVSLIPICCDLYSTQSQTYTALKQHKNAIKSLETMDALAPNSMATQMNLTKALINDKQYGRVIDLASKALRQDSQYLEFYYLRAQAYAALNQNQEAIADLSKFIVRQHSAISIKSDDRLARSLRASLYEKTGKLTLAKIDRDFLAKEQLDAYKDTTFAGKEK